MTAVSVRGTGPERIGKKIGKRVWKFTVTVAVTGESGAQGLAQVTFADALVRFAAARTVFIRAIAGAELKGLVTAPTRAPSRAADTTTLNVASMRLASTPAKSTSNNVGRTTMNSSVLIPRQFPCNRSRVFIASSLLPP